MKRFFYLSLAAMMVLAMSCKKDKPGDKIPDGAVDLGIEMTREDGTTYKLYWAKSNLSETGLCANPEDYGDYYAWGETEPYYEAGHGQDNPCDSWRNGKTGYDWSSYKFRTSGDSWNNVKFSKYNTKESYGPVDNITELQRGEEEGDTDDDAARAKLGGKWRMPTDAEWAALLTFKWEWSTTNGINGRLVTASNGNSIFLPAAGDRFSAYFHYAGSDGDYWSSSLTTDDPYGAWRVSFDSGNVNRRLCSRYSGLSIRPVYEE